MSQAVPESLVKMRANANAERKRVSGERQALDGQVAQIEERRRHMHADFDGQVAELERKRLDIDAELATVEHVIAVLGGEPPASRPARASRGGRRHRKSGKPAGERLLAELAAQGGTAHIDTLAEKLGVKKSYVSSLLWQLSRDDTVRKLGGGRWAAA